MGLLEVVTIVFVVLKLTGAIDWSWWLVLLPEIIAIGLYTLVYVVGGAFAVKGFKKIKKELEKDEDGWFKH